MVDYIWKDIKKWDPNKYRQTWTHIHTAGKMKQTKERTKWTAVALDPLLLGILCYHGSSLTRCRSHLHANGGAIASLRGRTVAAGTWRTHTHTHSNILTRIHSQAQRHTLASLLMFQIEDAGVCHLSLFVSASPSPQALTDAPACRVCAYMYHGVTLCVHTHTHKDKNITHNVHLQDSNVNLVSEGHECLMK